MDRITEEQIRLLVGNFAGLEDYFNKRNVRRQPYNSTNAFTLGSSADFKLLDAPTHIANGSVISRNAVASISGASNQGGIVAAALAGLVGTAANTTITDSSGNILNLVEIRESVTNNPVVYQDVNTDRKVYGLIQCSNTVTDSDAVGVSGSENLQISFVYYNSSDVLTTVQIGAGTYEFQRNTLVAERYKPVLTLEGGAVERDVVDLKSVVEMLEARYDITTSFPANDVWDLATGAGTTGVSTPDGDYATIALPANATEFEDNPRVVVTRNGVEQQKGVTVIYNSSTMFHFVPALAIGERITVKAPLVLT